MTRTESACPKLLRRALPLLAVLASLIAAQPAWSLPEDRNQPMTITADQGNFSSGRGEATFTGNVYLKQGTLEVWADTLDVRRDPQTGDITFLEAKGEPARYQELPSTEDGLIEVRGMRIEYRPEDDLIITEGNGHLTQAGSDIRADYIRYNLLDESLDVRSQRSVDNNEDAPQATWTLQPGAID
jgi:lipopolysaccharide export system protein LptA